MMLDRACQRRIWGRQPLAVVAVFAGVLMATIASGQETTERPLLVNSPVKYFKGLEEPPVDWREVDFDDGTWLSGPMPLGYGPDITFGTKVDDMPGSYWSVFGRQAFQVSDVDLVTRIQLVIRHDDGFIAYLNGVELDRRNMPATGVTNTTPGTDHEISASTYNQAFLIDAIRDAIRTGTNVLSWQVHNATIDSSDLVMETQLLMRVLPPRDPEFIRGTECDGSPALDIGDAIYLLRWQFGAFYPAPGCVKSCDMNDDGVVNLSDAAYGLGYLFQNGPAFPAPYPTKGTDPTDDGLSCVSGEPQ